MFGAVSVYEIGKHSLVGGEIGAYIDRLGDDADRPLFVVRYNELGAFCICEWMSPNKDVFVDVMNLGKSLTGFTRKKAQELKRRIFRPVTANEVMNYTANAESDYLHMRQDMNSEEWDRQARVEQGE